MLFVNRIFEVLNLLGPRYNYQHDRSAIGETIGSLIDFIENPPSFLDDPLLGFMNWDFSRLKEETGHLRKPRIKTDAYVTSKDNMVLEWYPLSWERWSFAISIDDPEEQKRMNARRQSIVDKIRGDFIVFYDYTADYGRPVNRLIHLSGPWRLNQWRAKWRVTAVEFEASQLLMRLVRRLFRHFYQSLERNFELAKVRDLYLMETEEGSEFAFLNAEEEEERAWIEQTFTSHGISPEIFMETFQRAGYKYATTAKILAKEHSVRFTTDKIKKILKRLEEKHHTLYEKYFLKHSEKKEGQVIPFRKNNGG